MEKYCQNCKQANPSEAAFCLNCASPLPRNQASGYQQPNAPNFGGQAQQNFASAPANSGAASQRATAALGLAIAGLFCCGPFTTVPAVIVGWMEIQAIKQGQSPSAGMMFAQIGLWGGIAVTILQTAAFLFWILLSMAAGANQY